MATSPSVISTTSPTPNAKVGVVSSPDPAEPKKHRVSGDIVALVSTIKGVTEVVSLFTERYSATQAKKVAEANSPADDKAVFELLAGTYQAG